MSDNERYSEVPGDPRRWYYRLPPPIRPMQPIVVPDECWGDDLFELLEIPEEWR